MSSKKATTTKRPRPSASAKAYKIRQEKRRQRGKR